MGKTLFFLNESCNVFFKKATTLFLYYSFFVIFAYCEKAEDGSG